MTINSNVLYKLYDDAMELAEINVELQADFKPVATQFEEKRSNPDISVMVYGVYNAGKSTLINALLGQDIAPTGDIPLTSEVHSYQWNNYAILDTPGVDAPLAHEVVAKEQMLKTDAVIFVVNPSGAAEEAKTLEKLVDLLEAKKKVFLVFNEKNPLAQEDFIRLKDQTRIRIQELAARRGMNDVLHEVPMLKVNAARALKGRLTNHVGLINSSGYADLELALYDFFAAIGQDDINNRLSNELYNFLLKAQHYFSGKVQSKVVDTYNELIKKLQSMQAASISNISVEIKHQAQNIKAKVKSAILKNPQGCNSVIEAIFTEASTAVTRVIEDELKHVSSSFSDDIDAAEAIIQRHMVSASGYSIPEVETSAGEERSSAINITSDMVNEALGSVTSFTKPEHIVDGLKLVKEWFPSIMKGIGPKTMEKWGGLVVAKWLPYAGTAVSVATSLWDMFAEDASEKRAREEAERVEKQRQRFHEEVNSIATSMGTQFESSMIAFVDSDIKSVFTAMLDKVKTALDKVSVAERENSEMLIRVQRLMDASVA